MKKNMKKTLIGTLCFASMLIIKGILDGGNAPKIAYILVFIPIVLEVVYLTRDKLKDV